MAAAVTPAAEMALKNAGIGVKDLKAVKTHNPFSVNDIVMGKMMNIPEAIFNNYGSSLIFGHPQGPTGARCTVELIEELVKIGGGYGFLPVVPPEIRARPWWSRYLNFFLAWNPEVIIQKISFDVL